MALEAQTSRPSQGQHSTKCGDGSKACDVNGGGADRGDHVGLVKPRVVFHPLDCESLYGSSVFQAFNQLLALVPLYIGSFLRPTLKQPSILYVILAAHTQLVHAYLHWADAASTSLRVSLLV